MRSLVLTCLLLAAAVALAGCGNDDNPAAPGGGTTVLLLTDEHAGPHVTGVLEGAGLTVRDGGLFSDFDGTGLAADVDAVVILSGRGYNNDMPDAGEAALLGFVQQGGGLFATEWLNYAIGHLGHHQILKAVLPTGYADSYGSGTETCTVLVQHPVTGGLPGTFATPADQQYSILAPRSGAQQLVRGSRSGAAVVAWELPGRVVQWNGAPDYDGTDVWNDEIDRLIANAATWVCGSPRRAAAIATETVRVRSTFLVINRDGDGAAGSTSSPGDFYVSVRLLATIGDVETQVAGRSGVLFQGVDGDNPFTGVEAVAELPRVDGMRIRASISFLENDPSGPQASAGNSVEFTYDAEAGCWDQTGEDVCWSGTTLSGTVHLAGAGDPLDADLLWQFGY